MLDVYFSEAAMSDLEAIRDYIAADNPEAAHRLLDDIEETCNRFGQHPGIGVSRDDLLPAIRLFPVRKTYAVFYRVLDDAVEIVRVVSRYSRKATDALDERQLADLYVLTKQEFPQSSDPVIDPQNNEPHYPGPRDSAKDFRGHVLRSLCGRGTLAAITEVERIRAMFPDASYLNRSLGDTRRFALESTWQPVTVSQLQELFSQPQKRLVRNGRELTNVVMRSLESLQQKLHGESPSIRALWDRTGGKKNGIWTPVDEDDFSNHVASHLSADLKDSGIVALREVQIRRGNASLGERTDIYVTAVVPGVLPNQFDSVRVIIESKGCCPLVDFAAS